MTLTKREFYKSIARINRESAVWLHEGVIREGKGESLISADAKSRFCEQIRGFLMDIEGPSGGAPYA